MRREEDEGINRRVGEGTKEQGKAGRNEGEKKGGRKMGEKGKWEREKRGEGNGVRTLLGG